jgi:hypothetical protein
MDFNSIVPVQNAEDDQCATQSQFLSAALPSTCGGMQMSRWENRRILHQMHLYAHRGQATVQLAATRDAVSCHAIF